MSDHLILKLMQNYIQIENTVRKLKRSYFLAYQMLHEHIAIVKQKQVSGPNSFIFYYFFEYKKF